jgi:short-subunit dehydrogenase
MPTFEKNTAMNVLITGASRGLGKCIAEHFAAEGANLILCSRSMQQTIGWQQQLITKHGISVSAFDVDIRDVERVKAFAGEILTAGINIDILVNNAGSYVPGSVWNEPDGQLEEMLQVNLLSAYHLTRAIVPSMIARKSGHIFNMASIASFMAYPNGGSYSISKYALAGFSKNLREELKTHQIKVTTIYPGAAFTPSWEGAGIPAERFMKPDDVANMIVASSKLSLQACVEEIILRPQLGDI